MAPAAASAEPMPFERTLAKKALHARISKEMPKDVPVAADIKAYVAGAQLYRGDCAVCHGLPGQPDSLIAQGMFPFPPQLFRGKGVTDDEPGETYWKISNGIRLTGMPGFQKTLSPTEIWQISVMLANADKLPPDVKQMLSVPIPNETGSKK